MLILLSLLLLLNFDRKQQTAVPWMLRVRMSLCLTVKPLIMFIVCKS